MNASHSFTNAAARGDTSCRRESTHAFTASAFSLSTSSYALNVTHHFYRHLVLSVHFAEKVTQRRYSVVHSLRQIS